MTPNLRIVNDYIRAKYGLAIGVTNCRKIAGSQTYSQHSWSNAGDIYTTNKDLQDKVAADIKATFGPHVRNVLTWRYNAAHWNHVHVDMWPKGWLTPPCDGGTQLIKYKDGTVASTAFPLTIEEDTDMAILTVAEEKKLRQFLVELDNVNSNVSFVRYLIPWFRKWRRFLPADFDTLPASEVVTITREQ